MAGPLFVILRMYRGVDPTLGVVLTVAKPMARSAAVFGPRRNANQASWRPADHSHTVAPPATNLVPAGKIAPPPAARQPPRPDQNDRQRRMPARYVMISGWIGPRKPWRLAKLSQQVAGFHASWWKPAPCPCSKSPQGRGRLVIFTSRPYRHGHGDDSLCRCIDLRFPLSQPRRARTQTCRS